MVVASRCFAFRALITQARIWKSFSDQNSTSLLYLPIPFAGWKSLQTSCVNFFSLKLKNPYLGKHLLAKQELITRERLRVQDFATGKNFCFNQCHNKEFFVFSQESYFLKVIENFFPVFASPDINTRGVGRILYCYANPRLRLGFVYPKHQGHPTTVSPQMHWKHFLGYPGYFQTSRNVF